MATPHGSTYINTTGNPGMAIAGSVGNLMADHCGKYGLIASGITLNIGVQ